MTNLIIFFADYAIFILFATLPILWLKRKREASLHAALSTFLAWAIAKFIKEFFFVPRPFMLNGNAPTVGYFSTGSFPSTHTIAAFAVAVSVFLHHRRLGLILIIVSTAIGASRILGGVHYPIDIIGGAIIGTFIAWLINKFHPTRLLDKLSL